MSEIKSSNYSNTQEYNVIEEISVHKNNCNKKKYLIKQ